MKKAFTTTFRIAGMNDFQQKTLKGFTIGVMFLTFSLLSREILAQVSGTVFNDFNNNGTKDATTALTEVGLGGVIVKAYDASGASVSATTDANGIYSFPNSGVTASSKSHRLEFINSGSLAGYKSYTTPDQTNGAADLADSDASALGVITIKSGRRK